MKAAADWRSRALRQQGRKAQLLDNCNIGAATGQKDRVVDPAAVTFHEPGTERYGLEERRFMLELARQTLVSAASHGTPPEVCENDVPPRLVEKRACFVTLTKAGLLRGCIGHLTATEPLYRAVIDNACGAALRDPRFAPVQPDELAEIRIEISVLTEPQPLAFTSPEDLLARLRPNEDGVLLRIGARTATFLPQVWAQIPDKEKFLGHLAHKAGCEPAAWRGEDVSVSLYRVECFEEDLAAPRVI